MAYFGRPAYALKLRMAADGEHFLNRTKNCSLPVALVTGSTSGIGAAIARRLSNEGYAVVLHSRSSAEAGHALATELGNAIYVQADLAEDADRIRLVREAVSRWDRLDVLVNNAGISRVIPHADLLAASPAIWHELHEVNVVAPFRLVAEAATALRAAATRGRPACVVNISSHAGVRPKGASFIFVRASSNMCRETRRAEDTVQRCFREQPHSPSHWQDR